MSFFNFDCNGKTDIQTMVDQSKYFDKAILSTKVFKGKPKLGNISETVKRLVNILMTVRRKTTIYL